MSDKTKGIKDILSKSGASEEREESGLKFEVEAHGWYVPDP
jgi:hypothetical protein